MLLAEARLLRPSERQLVVRDLQSIHPRVPGLELLHGTPRMRHVGRPDRRSQAELRIVGEAQTFVQVLDPPNREGRSEYLLLPHARAVRHVLEDRRLDEPAPLVLVPIRPPAAENRPGPLAQRILDLRFDLSPLRLGVHRPHPAVLVETVAGLQLGRARDQLLHQGVVDALLDVQALDGQACLPTVEKAADRDGACRCLEIRIVEHDARVAPAKLEGDLLQAFCRFSHHLLACRRRACERDLANERVLDDGLACRLSQHDVDHALRQTAFDECLDAGERRERRCARGLEDHCVARRDCRRNLVRGQRQREVPRHYRAADADGHSDDQAVRGGIGQRHVLAVDLVGDVREPRDVLAEPLSLEPRLEQCLSLLLGEDRGDLLDLAEHVKRGPVQDLSPLRRRELGPARKRLPRSLRCFVDVGRTAGRNFVDNFTCRRVSDLVGLARSGLRPFAFDDHRRHSVRTPLR